MPCHFLFTGWTDSCPIVCESRVWFDLKNNKFATESCLLIRSLPKMCWRYSYESLQILFRLYFATNSTIFFSPTFRCTLMDILIKKQLAYVSLVIYIPGQRAICYSGWPMKKRIDLRFKPVGPAHSLFLLSKLWFGPRIVHVAASNVGWGQKPSVNYSHCENDG